MDQTYAHVLLKRLEALPKKKLLVGVEKGDAGGREAISIDQWRVYAARLLNQQVPREVARRAGGGSAGDPQAMFDRLKDATVFLYVFQFENGKLRGAGSGTGFFIGPDLIMTNQHVVEKATDSVHVFSNAVGWKRAAYVTGSGMMGGQGLDVKDYRSPVYLSFSAEFGIFQDLVVAGYPGLANDLDKGYADLMRFIKRRLKGEKVAYVKGTVPAVKYAFGKLQSAYRGPTNYELIQHGVQTAKGNSGSALVNMCGEVVGIHAMGWAGGKKHKGTKYNYAYSVNEIRKFLQQRGIRFDSAAGACTAQAQ